MMTFAMVAAISVLSAQAVCAENADKKSVFVNYDDTHYALSRTHLDLQVE